MSPCFGPCTTHAPTATATAVGPTTTAGSSASMHACFLFACLRHVLCHAIPHAPAHPQHSHIPASVHAQTPAWLARTAHTHEHITNLHCFLNTMPSSKPLRWMWCKRASPSLTASSQIAPSSMPMLVSAWGQPRVRDAWMHACTRMHVRRVYGVGWWWWHAQCW